MTEPTPDLVLFLNRDVFFAAPVGNAVRGRGLRMRTVPDAARFAGVLAAQPGEVILALIDMNILTHAVDWPVIDGLIAAGLPFPVVGFGAHTDVETRRAAKGAGLTRIYANGQFKAELDAILARHLPALPDPKLRDPD